MRVSPRAHRRAGEGHVVYSSIVLIGSYEMEGVADLQRREQPTPKKNLQRNKKSKVTTPDIQKLIPQSPPSLGRCCRGLSGSTSIQAYTVGALDPQASSLCS